MNPKLKKIETDLYLKTVNLFEKRLIHLSPNYLELKNGKYINVSKADIFISRALQMKKDTNMPVLYIKQNLHNKMNEICLNLRRGKYVKTSEVIDLFKDILYLYRISLNNVEDKIK